MAQSALTVTPPTPTPPTNMSCTGATPPNVPNYTRETMNDRANGMPWGTVTNKPPPFFDDGAAGSLVAFAAPTAALASGTSAADNAGSAPGFNGTAAAGAGGTGINNTLGTYPGATNGVVPASTSIAHEAAGSEVVATAPGSISYTYPDGQGAIHTTRSVTDVTGYNPNFNGAANSPNSAHASSLSPATAPALASIAPPSVASGVGTQLLTATGTNFTKQSVIVVNGVPQTTTFVSATSLTATVTKKTTAGTWPVIVVTGGVVQTAPQTWTFT